MFRRHLRLLPRNRLLLGRSGIPALVFVAGLVCTFVGWQLLRHSEQTIEEARSNATADGLLNELRERLGKVDFILRGSAGLFGAQNLVERREFESYVKGLRLQAELPEVVGVGFARRTEANRAPAIEAMLSASFGRDIRINPVPAPDDKALIFPIVFFWSPDEAGSRVIGYDGYAEPVRRKAMDLTLTGHGLAMTAPLKLKALGDAPRSSGVLLYRVALPPDEMGEVAPPDGVIMLGINLDQMFGSLLGGFAQGYGLTVTDITDATPAPLFSAPLKESTSGGGVDRTLAFGDRTWRIAMDVPVPQGPVATSSVLAFAGVATSALLAVLLTSLTGQRQRAMGLAETMTDELRSSEKRFELAVSATEDGIWEWRADTGQLYLSNRCDRILGYPEGRLPRNARGILRSFAPEARREFLRVFRRHTHGQGPLDCIVPIRRIDGSSGWFHVAGQTEFDSQGRPLRTAGAASDVTELRRAQQAVIDSHAKLDSLYRDASFGMALVDGKGYYIQANSEFCRITGYTEDELHNLTFRVLTPTELSAGDGRNGVAEPAGGRVAPADREYVRKDGTRIPVMETTTQVGGSEKARWVIVEDATARKAGQKAIQEAHATNESLIAAIPDTLFQLDGAMRIVRYHGDINHNLAIGPESLIGLRLEDALPRELAARFGRAALAASRSGNVQRIEYSSRHEAGHERHFEARFRAVRTGGALAVVRDVTDLKEAELALRESEARWQFALDGAGDGVWDWNLVSGKVFRSGRWQTMLGYTAGELPESIDAWSTRVHPDDLAQTLEAQAAHLRGDTPIFTREFRLCCKDGHYKWILGRGLVVERDEAGKPLRMIGTQTDIDDVKSREAEILYHNTNLASLVDARTKDLMAAKEAAEAANEAKSLFLANMSHELRTPMHGVLSYASLGETRVGVASVDKLRAYFNRIRMSGERLLLLLNDLLDLSKFEAGRVILDISRVDMEFVVREVIHEFEALLQIRRLQVTVEREGPPPVIDGDAAKLTQVVRNLISNAAKFTPEGKSIHVRLWPETLPEGRRASDTSRMPGVGICVSDEGVGIPVEELDAVFEKFVQSSRTRTGAGGTGLGLAICREIVVAHRGHVSVRNNPAGGAEFTVILPVAEAPLSGARSAAEAEEC